MRSRVAVVIVAVLAAGCLRSPAPRDPVPRFTLTNQAGTVVRTEDLRGRLTVVSFIFTGCSDVCPLVMAHVARAQATVRDEALESTVRFVSITLDPGTDTPDVLQRYAARFGADTRTWDFLTGDSAEIGQVARAMGVTIVNDHGRLGHEGPVVLIDAHGEIARRYTDATHLAARIVDDVRQLAPTVTR